MPRKKNRNDKPNRRPYRTAFFVACGMRRGHGWDDTNALNMPRAKWYTEKEHPKEEATAMFCHQCGKELNTQEEARGICNDCYAQAQARQQAQQQAQARQQAQQRANQQQQAYTQAYYGSPTPRSRQPRTWIPTLIYVLGWVMLGVMLLAFILGLASGSSYMFHTFESLLGLILGLAMVILLPALLFGVAEAIRMAQMRYMNEQNHR